MTRERLLKLSLPTMIAVVLVLVAAGVLTGPQALLVAVMVDLALIALATRHVIVGRRRYHERRAAGADPWLAAEQALTVLLPPTAARLVVLEPLLWYCLVQWLLRRPPRGPRDFPYHRRSILGPLTLVVLLTTPVEVLLFELFIPWGWLRILVAVVALYALLWVIALRASLSVLPHQVQAEGLRVRYGVLLEGSIPYRAITSITADRARSPLHEGVRVDEKLRRADIAVGGRTDVRLDLAEPVSLRTLRGARPGVTLIRLAADDPEGLVKAVKGEIAHPASPQTRRRGYADGRGSEAEASSER